MRYMKHNSQNKANLGLNSELVKRLSGAKWHKKYSENNHMFAPCIYDFFSVYISDSGYIKVHFHWDLG